MEIYLEFKLTDSINIKNMNAFDMACLQIEIRNSFLVL